MPTLIKPITVLAWLVAMMLSPEALTLQGNLAGTGFLLPLIVALALHGLHIAAGPWPDETGRLMDGFGPGGTSLLLLVARPAVAVCLATATLVTAGFIFNEVFFYWFPNFGFAALLLMGLLALNLAGLRFAGTAQIVFAATAFVGLTGLVLAGLYGEPPETIGAPPGIDIPAFKNLGLGVVALLGYDLVGYTARDIDRRRTQWFMGIGIAAAGVLFWAWNATALAYVGPERLADTTIPHLLAAKAVMGSTGRFVIGVVVIAGACAAVNFLFQAVAQMMAAMSERGLMPAITGVSTPRPWLPLVGMAGLTGLLMAVGFAGSDWLDVSLRAGLILWMAGIGLTHLPPLMPGRRQNDHPVQTSRSVSGTMVHLALLATMTTLGTVLILTDDDPGMLLRAMLALVTMAAVLAAAGLMAARRPLKQHHKTLSSKEGVSS